MDTEAERAMLARALVEATTAIDYLEQTGDFRYDGLTLEQWWQIRTQRTLELDAIK